MQFAVTDIEFDFDDSCYDISPLTFEDERDAVDDEGLAVTSRRQLAAQLAAQQ